MAKNDGSSWLVTVSGWKWLISKQAANKQNQQPTDGCVNDTGSTETRYWQISRFQVGVRVQLKHENRLYGFQVILDHPLFGHFMWGLNPRKLCYQLVAIIHHQNSPFFTHYYQAISHKSPSKFTIQIHHGISPWNSLRTHPVTGIHFPRWRSRRFARRLDPLPQPRRRSLGSRRWSQLCSPGIPGTARMVVARLGGDGEGWGDYQGGGWVRMMWVMTSDD